MKAFKIKRGTETYYRVDLPQRFCPAGKRRSVTGRTRAEALKKAQEKIDQYERGLDRNGGDKSLQEFLKDFLAYYKTDGGVAPSTYQDYRYHIEKHVVPALGKIKLRELGSRAVDELTRSLKAKGLSPRTAHYAYAVLRRALQFAVDWKYIPTNPASARVRAAKRRTPKGLSKIRFLTQNEARMFIEAVRDNRLEALYVLAITTGMRQGEMLGLEWSDIDLENGKVTVSRALHRTKRPVDEENPDDWFTFRNPKTPGSRRTI